MSVRRGQDPTDEDVRRWIRKHGVTRCPAAAVEFSTGAISEADRQALRDRPPPEPISWMTGYWMRNKATAK